MTTEDHRHFPDLDAIVGDLDSDPGSDAGAEKETAQDPVTDSGAANTVTVQAAGYRRSFQVAPGQQVKVRKGPTTAAPVVRKLAGGAWIQIRCQRRGQKVSGPCGTTDIWDNIAPGQYVSDAYVRTGSSGPVAPSCTS
ncbi:hypothetical protein [Streptomyces sp. NPDC101150]|uniref:hypothetical protein n=1 Tax=Streptomyces sp. NPDC101150 TaxID=3366114 RepID=UPI003801F3C7